MATTDHHDNGNGQTWIDAALDPDWVCKESKFVYDEKHKTVGAETKMRQWTGKKQVN